MFEARPSHPQGKNPSEGERGVDLIATEDPRRERCSGLKSLLSFPSEPSCPPRAKQSPILPLATRVLTTPILKYININASEQFCVLFITSKVKLQNPSYLVVMPCQSNRHINCRTVLCEVESIQG